MRKLQKGPKPQILRENEKVWTKEYCDCLEKGQIPAQSIATRYNHKSIKMALEVETSGKCAYCESKIKHVSYGDIEHILPKNINARPDLYVSWDNLTLACEQCNRVCKKDYYDVSLPLINPYLDEPKEHLIDLGAIIMPQAGDERANITRTVLDLNRPELIERRLERIESVEHLLNRWIKETQPTIKNMLEEQLHNECQTDKEYSSTIIAYLQSEGFPVKGNE